VQPSRAGGAVPGTTTDTAVTPPCCVRACCSCASSPQPPRRRAWRRQVCFVPAFIRLCACMPVPSCVCTPARRGFTPSSCPPPHPRNASATAASGAAHGPSTPGVAPPNAPSRVLRACAVAAAVVMGALSKETALVAPVLLGALHVLVVLRRAVGSAATAPTAPTAATAAAATSSAAPGAPGRAPPALPPATGAVGAHAAGGGAGPVPVEPSPGHAARGLPLARALRHVVAVARPWWGAWVALLAFQVALLVLRLTVVSAGCVCVCGSAPLGVWECVCTTVGWRCMCVCARAQFF
jgi:hypothetical protein